MEASTHESQSAVYAVEAFAHESRSAVYGVEASTHEFRSPIFAVEAFQKNSEDNADAQIGTPAWRQRA